MRTTNTIKLQGVDYVPVKVECEVTPGIGIHLVGLADAAVKCSLLRTVTAMQSLGYYIPGKKLVINLAPADLTKEGSGYDLAIALSVIAESGQSPADYLESFVILGELALDGHVREVPGVVQAVQAAKDQGYGVIVPRANAAEVEGLFDDYKPVYYVDHLAEAIAVVNTLSGAREPGDVDERPESEGWLE